MLQISVNIAIRSIARQYLRYCYEDTIVLGHILMIYGHNFKRLCGVLRSTRFITTHYVSHFRRDCRGRFLNCQKICHGVHGYPGVLRLPIPFPCAASRLSRFAHGCLKRGRRDRREHSVNAVLVILPYRIKAKRSSLDVY